MNEFIFNPPDGLRDKGVYATNPTTEDEARGQIQDPLDQIKTFLNTSVKNEFASLLKTIQDEVTIDKSGNKIKIGDVIIRYGELSNQSGNAASNTIHDLRIANDMSKVIYADLTVRPTDNTTWFTGAVNVHLNIDSNTNTRFVINGLNATKTYSYNWFMIGY